MSNTAEAELSDDDYACMHSLCNFEEHEYEWDTYVVKICKHSRMIAESGIFYIACCYVLY